MGEPALQAVCARAYLNAHLRLHTLHIVGAMRAGMTRDEAEADYADETTRLRKRVADLEAQARRPSR